MSVFLQIDPHEWVANNQLAFAVRDRFPVNEGHTLVVPRRLVATWWEASTDEQHALMELVDVVKRRLDAELSPDGYNVGFNAGSAAGQTVDHLHLHVIPRFDGDVDDPRGGVRHVIPAKGNYLTSRPSQTLAPSMLITPFDGRLKLELLRCMIRPDLDRIDLLVSFVMRSGINLIARHLDEALERGARVRLLTTDYLQITDASALGFFLDRIGHGIAAQQATGQVEVRVFSDSSTSFHPKAYIFSSSDSGAGVAFVGSSNLSWSGITTGVEWNIETRQVKHLIDEFDRLWTDPRSVPLTGDWLRAYDELRQARRANAVGSSTTDALTEHVESGEVVELAVAEVGDEPDGDIPRPWSVQSEALAALEAGRRDGHESGLVVMATGLGKTWLGAFDSTRPEFHRTLFVAHREEILSQARDTFRQIRPGGSLTMFTGGERDPGGDVVFASVQSLHRNLDQFEPEQFDYVIVDEFHHAAATTYRRVLAHFRPRFLLGLTATPDRADAADLLALCDDNLVYDVGLVEGVRRELLSPFRYRAIADVADYEHIPWRNGRFDIEELTAQLATQQRADQVLDEWRELGGIERRALGFCCTIAHAEFMADHFRANGVAAVAVHSGPTSAMRAESLERLALGELPVIFTVDLFNEGVDVPTVDLVMLLRPTESPVVFFQQLGRGLRRAGGKDRLEVIDLVGNHRSFLLKARLLSSLSGRLHLTDREAVALLDRQRDQLTSGAGLPPGCSIVVDPEVVDLLGRLLGPARAQDRLLELARQWIDDHDGRRPTALQLSLVTEEAHTLKAVGGWFGFLDRHGLLDFEEQDVLHSIDGAHDFLLWIEHGSYTKSYKLVTLAEMERVGRLRSGVSLHELAAMCRWAILRDNDLRADLADAGSAFRDVHEPTPDEWQAYWRKNPIAAITGSSRGAQPWFEVDGDLVSLRRSQVDVPNSLGDVFDAMVRELVEYRLHRYLAQRKARRVGERRRPQREGRELDAEFTVETTGTVPTSIVIESAGGSAGSPAARNTEYVDGFDAVLQRLTGLDAVMLDAYIDTTSTRALAVADRRLSPGESDVFPVRLGDVSDLVELRRQILRSMAKVGRSASSKGGGNARKRTRLVVEVPGSWTASTLADAIASGNPPNGASRRATG